MADPQSMTDSQLRGEAERQRQFAERDVPGAAERARALDTEAWRRFDVSKRDESKPWWA